MYRFCSLLLLIPLALAAEEPRSRDLFNGKDLEGWIVEGAQTFKDGDKDRPVWTVRDNMISCQVNKGSFGFLRYGKQEFTDFHLHLEYRFTPPASARARRGNSGVGIRTVAFDPKRSTDTRPSYASYEIQLLDDADKPANKHSTGSLYRYVAPSEQAARPAPEWNTLDIKCAGPRIEITLNGKKIIDVDQSTMKELQNKPLKGYICLQNHGSPIDFRHIRVRKLRVASK